MYAFIFSGYLFSCGGVFMRYLITFSYDGTNFNGYQKQPNLRTIQGELESALKFISGGNDITVNSSGRTDKGVHALNQKAHFDLDKNITCYKLKCALNTYTKDDIYIKSVEAVADNFPDNCLFQYPSDSRRGSDPRSVPARLRYCSESVSPPVRPIPLH